MRRPPAQYHRRLLGSAACLLAGALAGGQPVWAEERDPTAMSLEELLNVKVVGASKYEQRQADVAAAVSVITRQDIATFGWRTLAEALGSLPGVHTTYDRQYTYIGTRGFGLPGDFNTRLLLNVDGNRVNDGVFDQAYIGREFPIDIDLIERIEFIPGPGGAVYGQNAMLGVVNVITRRGADVGGFELSGTYQHPQALREGRATWGARTSTGWDTVMSVSGLRATGESRTVDFGAAGVSGVATGLDGERDREFFARVARGRWTSMFSYGDRRKDDPLGTYLSDPLVAGQYQRDKHTLGQLQFDDAFRNDALHVTGRLFFGAERYIAPFLFDGAHTEQTGSSNWVGGEARVVSTAHARHTLMAGVEYQGNIRQDQTYVDASALDASVSIPGSGTRSGVYLQDEWLLGRAVSATLGARLDHNGNTGLALLPRVGLIGHAGRNVVWKVLYGRADREANVFERDFTFTGQVANHALRRETIDTFEAVADTRVNASLTLRASVYHWDMRHLIVLGIDPDSGLPQYQNGAGVHALGAEISALQSWSWGGRLRASLSYQDPDLENEVSVPNSPTWLAKITFSERLPDKALKFGYELQAETGREAFNGMRSSGHVLSNVTATREHVVPRLDLSVSLGNVFDARYSLPGSRNNWQLTIPQDGRSLRVYAAYRF